ncbi:Cytochrome b-c1 complex subunit 7 [Apodemus speciosus]|uniref:Cytochrome b-c1 complex subunit 7 n=1 Tax=Apodemus speciosus TaxID=105296 RepID=A0ABQ0FGE9_APOSI
MFIRELVLPIVAASSKWLDGFRKWYYNAAGFNKLGLMRDDTIHETEDVKEAIRRLPENLYNDRMFRIKRALDLTMRHQILPKDQWTKYEEDKFYLEPYLKEVIRERKEREDGRRNDLVVKIYGCAWSHHIFTKVFQRESQFKNYLFYLCLTLNKCLL